ncbi:MAG: IS200/IS605 family transposase [Balneolales bacterium]|nr:IS200/IS605 family transposase [Balneolales bacterium]
MPQSLVRNYVHIIFSTKNRIPLINSEVENELYRYIGGTCGKLECSSPIVGGYSDHIHILCLLSPKITLAKLIEQIKSNTSRWMKKQSSDLMNFYWQNGYGAFSVSPLKIDTVYDYISNQKEHHESKNMSFKKAN